MSEDSSPKGWMIHGSKIAITIDGKTVIGHLEERLLSQWPEKRTGLFVLIDDGSPHFPIPIQHFQPDNTEIYQYGIITQLIEIQ